MTDVSDEKLNEEAQKARELRAKRKAQALEDMLKTRGGRDVFWDLLSLGGIFQQNGSLTEKEANHINGKKFMAIEIFKQIMYVAPDRYKQMTEENTYE